MQATNVTCMRFGSYDARPQPPLVPPHPHNPHKVLPAQATHTLTEWEAEHSSVSDYQLVGMPNAHTRKPTNQPPSGQGSNYHTKQISLHRIPENEVEPSVDKGSDSYHCLNIVELIHPNNGHYCRQSLPCMCKCLLHRTSSNGH